MTNYAWTEWASFIVILLLGAFTAIGNSFILYVIWKHKLRSTTFKLVASQAVSDLMYGLIWAFLMKVVCATAVIGLPGGLLACEILSTLALSTFFVSVLTMMAIAIERYLKLVQPLASPRSPWIPILLTWVLGLTLAFLGMFNLRTYEFFTPTLLVELSCRTAFADYATPFIRHYVSNVALHVAGYIFPVCITAVAYYKILKIVKKRENDADLRIQRTEQKLLKEHRRRRMR